jgi:N-acetylglutamate synthase-like GNAT family acetyltransferase
MPQLHIRRATVDDLPALKALWLTAQLPADKLKDRVTEFQVVEADGKFAGAIGVQIIRQHARLHSEEYADFSVADAARELFWERIQKLAANHGVFRVWMNEASSFWTRWGFQPASVEILARLPDEWKNLEGNWLTLELKNEDAINAVLKNQFGDFMATEKRHTAQLAENARKFKLFVTVASFGIFFICLAIVAWMILKRPALGH